MEAWLTAIRALHFGAAIVLFGQFAFACCVAPDRRLSARFGAWVAGSLAAAVLTALAWLAIEAGNMSGLALSQALREGTVGVVLTRTFFGRAWLARAALAAVLAIALVAMRRQGGAGSIARTVAAACALLILAALACAGHAAGGVGADRIVRVAVDALHLVAAGAWLGALLPLVGLLRAAGREPSRAALALASCAVQRFSVLGVACVGVLILTGIVNTLYAIHEPAAFLTSRYGRELAVKICMFLVIVLLAAVNRTRLSPRLVAADSAAASEALRALRHNAIAEVALGFAIVAIVGNLGITMPPMHGR